MGKFVQLVVDGLSTGSIYAALALAIVLVNSGDRPDQLRAGRHGRARPRTSPGC